LTLKGVNDDYSNEAYFLENFGGFGGGFGGASLTRGRK
jgi:hypothetical protein